MSSAQPLTVRRPPPSAVAVPAIALRHRTALAVLALTALTFLAPSAPTYDPWAWIVWGREILHLDLSTVEGPSWKPLPVLLTTPFALFGELAPDLWLFVARAGAIAGVVFVYRLARRIGGIPGGAAAASAYAIAPWTIRNAWLGNSEGLLVALALAAVDRHVAGRRASAFALALGAALLRPEAWPFVGLYGLVLAWRDPRARVLVGTAFASLPVLWLGPEWWGSGDLLRAAHRAQKPNANSSAFAENPVLAVIGDFATMLTPLLWAGLVALVIVALARRAPGRAELALAGGLGAIAVIWVAEVAVMTSDGFSGNARYLILPAALACVLAGAGAGWLARALIGPHRVLGATALVVLSVVAAIGFAIPSVQRLPRLASGLAYQARLTDGLDSAVVQAGGAGAILACGEPYSGAFQVPAVAWRLNLHTVDVGLRRRPPAVAFRARTTSATNPVPPLESIGGENGTTTLAIAGGWRIVGACRDGA